MSNLDKLCQLIESAAEVAGGQNQLARLIGEDPGSLANMKKGKRPANWRVRGKLRVILGESPEHAFMAAMAEDLEQSENADEKKAADGFRTILAAFSDAGGDGGIRTLDEAINPILP